MVRVVVVKLPCPRVRVGSAAAAGHRVPINIRTVRRWRAGLRTHGPHPAIHPPYQTHLYCEDAAMPPLTISTHNRGAHTQFGARRTSSICFSDLLSQESAELEWKFAVFIGFSLICSLWCQCVSRCAVLDTVYTKPSLVPPGNVWAGCYLLRYTSYTDIIN